MSPPLQSFEDILFFDLASPHDKLATRYSRFKKAQAHMQSLLLSFPHHSSNHQLHILVMICFYPHIH